MAGSQAQVRNSVWKLVDECANSCDSTAETLRDRREEAGLSEEEVRKIEQAAELCREVANGLMS